MVNHTFIICAYKESEYLESCIKSLLAQKKKSKIIISTSTKNNFIVGIAQKFEIPVHSHEESGIGIDWNYGLVLADTKYATITHQDDIYFSNYSESIIQQMDKCKNAIIGFSDYSEIVNNQIIAQTKNLRIKKVMLAPLVWMKRNKWIRRRILSLGSPICCPSVTYNLEMLRGFRFSEEMGVSLDWDAWERMSKMDGAFCYVPKILMGHRIHEESETTNAINDNKRNAEDYRMMCRFWPECLSKGLMRFYAKSQETNSIK